MYSPYASISKLELRTDPARVAHMLRRRCEDRPSAGGNGLEEAVAFPDAAL